MSLALLTPQAERLLHRAVRKAEQQGVAVGMQLVAALAKAVNPSLP